jgi:aspartyl-tRNA(Asn)/glutamyl-tRNA(Gln) amidotransferase subunit A
MASNASLVFLPVRQLGEMVRSEQVSPVELTQLALGRLEELGPRYNAVVTITRARALREARRAEQEIASGRYRGPLHGIPYGAKDLLATSEGIPTTWGASPLRGQVFDYDATVIRKLEEAGAVLVAKLAMVEFAGGMGYRRADASFTGPGINPWNRDYWSGGSSSGPGSAVAAGLVPFAIGSETGGSILAPSSFCGIAGLRPTYGRVSRYGAMALSWTLDKLGPMGLGADDCGLVFEALAGHDPHDLSTTDRTYRYQVDDAPSRRFRLCVIRGATDAVEEEAKANFEQALTVLGKVADIEEVTLPDLPYAAVNRTINLAESASAFEEFLETGQLAELSVQSNRGAVYARASVLATDYLRALRLRGLIAKGIDDLLDGYDALVSPTRSGVALPLDEEFPVAGNDVIGPMGNVAGLPAISVPNGFGEHGLPTGVQFMGRAYGENDILAVARTYQSLTSWHTMHPSDLVPSG